MVTDLLGPQGNPAMSCSVYGTCLGLYRRALDAPLYHQLRVVTHRNLA